MAKVTNPRKKKLDSICTNIAMFMMQDTFTDEVEAQKLLNECLILLDQAGDLLVKSDEEHSS